MDLTLAEIKRLQEETPINGDVSTVLEIEQREYETLQEVYCSFPNSMFTSIYIFPFVTTF